MRSAGIMLLIAVLVIDEQLNENPNRIEDVRRDDEGFFEAS
jgi:hypothetical protein